MLCRDVEENEIAERYLRGQLDSAAQDEFELHILDCSRCLASVELLQAVSEDLASRAPEIRTQASIPEPRARWSWVAVAVLSILVSQSYFFLSGSSSMGMRASVHSLKEPRLQNQRRPKHHTIKVLEPPALSLPRKSPELALPRIPGHLRP